MSGYEGEREWVEVRIGITSEEAIQFLEDLADDEGLRDRMEANPREVLLERNIDLFPGTPERSVRLPPPEELREYARTLRDREATGTTSPPWSHGFAVMLVSHGSPPPPPKD